MQLPNSKTPITRCLALATYTGRMLSKFPENPQLVEGSQRMNAGRQSLAEAEAAYQAALAQSLVLRVDVGHEDYLSDMQVRRTQQLAEIQDGRKGGRIVSWIFPDGSRPVTRLQGDSQIAAMQDLEGRLGAAADIWPEAEAQRAAIAEARTRYQVALAARQENERLITDLRAARDAARERFLDLYVQLASMVRAEFPRDGMLQGLFFDKVRNARPRRGDGDEPDTPYDDGDELPDEPADTPAA